MNIEQKAASRGSETLQHEGVRRLYLSSAPESAWNMRDMSLRILDVTLTSIALVLLSPLFLLLIIAIRIDSRGAAFFNQKRVGRDGREFWCYKFRSMHTDAEAQRHILQEKNERSGPVFKMKNDPRVTRVGRFLRRSSLDELPQLFNVLFGDMSLVGPRPGLPSEVAKYTAHQLGRLAVPPGLTGLWQVSGRADIGFESMIELDLRYIEERSLWTNIRIMAQTIPAVLTGRGAY